MTATSLAAPMPAAADQPDWGALSQLPGHPMMWVLILSELVVFGAMFVAFAVARAVDPAGFDASQALLDRMLGGINTLVLISSGYLAALAVGAGAARRPGRARGLMLAAIAVGTLFVALKLIEYGDKAALGIGIETNTFFTLYYLMTGFHGLHVVMGLIVLAIVAWKPSPENLETGAAFWHMVDLVWVIMFPLIYLLR